MRNGRSRSGTFRIASIPLWKVRKPLARRSLRIMLAVKCMDRTSQIRSVQLFSSLAEHAVSQVSAIAHEEAHRSGDILFRHGDVGDKLYLILEGRVRVGRTVPGMGEEALAVLGPGEVFGEMALLVETPRSADATAHSQCRLLAITKEDFDDLLFRDKALAYEVLWSTVSLLASRLASTNDKLTFLSATSKF